MNTPAGHCFFFFLSQISMHGCNLPHTRYAERHKWLICCSIDRVLSKNTPSFFTCGFSKMYFPPIWIDSASVRFMVWREPTNMASVFSVSEHLSLHRQKTRLEIRHYTLKFCGLGCLVQLRIICKFMVTDVVFSNFVRNRLREKGKKNVAKDRTLGNTIFQGQRRRV